MSSSVVSSPSEKRTLDVAASASPIATRTADGSAVPALQALPRGDGDAFEVEGGDELGAVPAGEGDVRRRGASRGARGSVDPRAGSEAQEPCLEAVAQGRRPPAIATGPTGHGAPRRRAPRRPPGRWCRVARRAPGCRRGAPARWRRPGCVIRAPIDFGPRILCAARLRVSASGATSAVRPNACTASTCTRVPVRRATAIASRDRLDDARLGVHRLHARRAARPPLRAPPRGPRDRAAPSGRTRTHRTRARPSRSSASATRVTDGCSSRLVTSDPAPRPRRRSAAPGCSPRCPPEVKHDVARVAAGQSGATASRASSTQARAARPVACTLDGLPHASRAARVIASTTSGSGGVVAFQSR